MKRKVKMQIYFPWIYWARNPVTESSKTKFLYPKNTQSRFRNQQGSTPASPRSLSEMQNLKPLSQNYWNRVWSLTKSSGDLYVQQSLRSKTKEHICRTNAKDNDRNGFNLENFKNQSYSSFTLPSEKLWYYFQRHLHWCREFFTTKLHLKAQYKANLSTIEKSPDLCYGLYLSWPMDSLDLHQTCLT